MTSSCDRNFRSMICRLWLAILFIILLAPPTLASAGNQGIEFSEEEKAFIRQHPVIVVGGEMDWPPYDYVKDGQYMGAANDYLKLLEKSTGLTFKVTTGYNWNELLQLIRERKIDVLPMLWYSVARTEYLNFTKPYHNVRHYIFVSKSDEKTQNLKDLEGRTIAIPKGYVQIEYLKQHHPMIKILEVKDSLSAIDSVITGKADALIENTALVAHYSREMQIRGIRPVSVFDVNTTELHMAARKDWPLLRDILQKGLNAITTEEKKRIAQRWINFEETAARSHQLKLDEDERHYLEHKGDIKACVDPDWMPLEKLENGVYTGLGSDYLKLFNSQLNNAIKVVSTADWSESTRLARERKCDLMILSSNTASRREYMNISTPYVVLPLVVATRNDVFFVTDLSRLVGKTLGVVASYALRETLERTYPQFTFVGVNSRDEGLKKVIAGELFGFVDAVSAIGYAIQTDYWGELKVTAKLDINWELGVATRKDEPILARIVEKLIAGLTEVDHLQIRQRWITVDHNKRVDYTLVWQIIAVFSIILLLALYRNRQLVIHRREQAKIQAVLEEREHLYRSLIETTDTGYLILDGEGKVLDANDEYVRISGHRRLDDILHRGVTEWTAEYDLARNAEEVRKCIQQGYTRDLEIDYIHPDGSIMPVDVNAKMVTKDGERQILALCRDITERRHQEEQILHQAHYDALTDLPNRFLSMDRLTQLMNEADRNHEQVAVLFLDLDDFKKINDTLGHDTGDKLLKEAASRLKEGVRRGDTVGRLGGDEFIVLLGGLSVPGDVRPVAETLLGKFRNVFRIDGRELVLTASIGISIYPDDGNGPSELLRNSDSAMYHSKEQGRNTYSFFTEEMNQGVSQRLLLEEQMHGALERGEFRLCYQPKVDLKSKWIVGAEALLRWNNPALGEISPATFIPIAEQSGMIVPIGEYVLTEALERLARWQADPGITISMAINLSPRQFRDPNLVRSIEKAMKRSGISAQYLELEITEGVLMSGHAYIDQALATLSHMGVSIAMDDFGTGYSSLSYLRNYPFDVLKIDREFVNDITEDFADLELVNAAIAMAHGLGLKVVAEGVETKGQQDLLCTQGCDYGQGYLFSKPVSPEEMTQLLKSQENP